MTIKYESKNGSCENGLIIEQCTLERRCNALTTFIQHVGFSGPQYFEGKRLFSMTKGEENEHESLLYHLPRKKGSYIILNFCPFCGGCVEPTAHRKEGTKANGEKVEMIFRYEPFTEEDYAKAKEAMEKYENSKLKAQVRGLTGVLKQLKEIRLTYQSPFGMGNGPARTDVKEIAERAMALSSDDWLRLAQRGRI